jgi:ABC-2 type transport system ATP-binding protein
MNVLRVEELRKSFRGEISLARREVLHGVTFHAGGGEILGFLGSNGAGKTTTIKLILGFSRPDRGRVSVFERPAGDRSVMARIGYLPENPYFYPHLTLREFLLFCGGLSGVDGRSLRRVMLETAERVGLEASLDMRLKGFSKGMLQRAGLAQTILHDPDLLILDEPFSGLDPLGRAMVRDLLLELKGRGKTIFFSSHILPDMEALCDRTCIIREGVIVRSIGLDELLRLEKGMVEITVRRCDREAVEAVGDYIESMVQRGEDLTLLVKSREFVRAVVQGLYNRGAEIVSIEPQHATLEEIFIGEITGSGREAATRSNEREPATSGKLE